MLKLIIILVFLLCWAIPQTVVGGYTVVDLTNITDENDRKEIDKVEQFAREEFSLKEDERKLKKLVWLGRRVVSGVLYYLQFESSAGENVVLHVHDQHWINSMKLVQIQQPHP